PYNSPGSAERAAGTAVAIGLTRCWKGVPPYLLRRIWRHLRRGLRIAGEHPVIVRLFLPVAAGARQPFRKSARRIVGSPLQVKSHGAVYFHHRRRGLLTRQGSRFGGA